MFELLEMLATFAYNYGVAGANMASLRGNHEVPVPDELIGDEEEYAIKVVQWIGLCSKYCAALFRFSERVYVMKNIRKRQN